VRLMRPIREGGGDAPHRVWGARVGTRTRTPREPAAGLPSHIPQTEAAAAGTLRELINAEQEFAIGPLLPGGHSKNVDNLRGGGRTPIVHPSKIAENRPEVAQKSLAQGVRSPLAVSSPL
jgi:hypothetical protein